MKVACHMQQDVYVMQKKAKDVHSFSERSCCYWLVMLVIVRLEFPAASKC